MKDKQLSFWNRLYYRLWWVQIRELKRDLETVKRRRDELIRDLSMVDLGKLREERSAFAKELKEENLEQLTFDDKSILDGSFTTIIGILGEQTLKLGKALKENVQLRGKVVTLEKELDKIRSKNITE